MKKIVMGCLVLFSALGCQSDDKEEVVKEDSTPVAIEFETIKQGNLTNNLSVPGNYTLRTVDQWVDFQVTANFFDDLRFDIDTYNVYEMFAVLDDVKETTGYSIEIKSISKVDGKLIVTVQRYNPELGENIFNKVSQPYHIVKLRKTGLPVVFK